MKKASLIRKGLSNAIIQRMTHRIGADSLTRFAVVAGAIAGLLLWAPVGRLAATTLEFLRDINQKPVGRAPEAVAFRGELFFLPIERNYGSELWKSDGSEAGTVLVKDIVPGPSGSGARYLTVVGTSSGEKNSGGRLFFTAWTALGQELWTTDGTPDGTVLVKDINPAGHGISNLDYVRLGVNHELFFVANDGLAGSELWKSDGTEAGTKLVRDIHPTLSSDPEQFIDVNGTLFFTAEDGVSGRELWKSDGTEAGTELLSNTLPGYGSLYISDLTNVNGTLFFIGDPFVEEQELWKSDGTPDGTIPLKDVKTNLTKPSALISFGGLLFFARTDGDSGGLWKSDGTPDGTVPVSEEGPLSPQFPQNLTVVGDTLLFTAGLEGFGRELWKSDGTAAGTVMVKDIASGASSSDVEDLVDVFGTLFFTADNGISGRALWRSDGTEAGTILVRELGSRARQPTAIRTAGVGSDPSRDLLFFSSAQDGARDYELWVSDGTEMGTMALKEIRPGPEGSDPEKFVDVDGRLFFAADDGTSGIQLWVSDGTEAGTVQVKELDLPTANAQPQPGVEVNGVFVFPAITGNDGFRLWKSDGTGAGTLPISAPGLRLDFWDLQLTRVASDLFFVANGISGKELWRTDGTAAGTALVKDIHEDGSSGPNLFVDAGGTLFFTADDGELGRELWKSDGTATGTLLVDDIALGASSSSPLGVMNFDGTLFFTADDGTSGQELWKSDGTAAGTALVRNIHPSGSSVPQGLFDADGTLFFTADDGTSGRELWTSDGSAAGTHMVKEINPTSHSVPRDFITAGGKFFFTAWNDTAGREIWTSDGTEVGTFLLKDINPGPGSAEASELTSFQGRLFFRADDGVHGFELWTSDGTPDGTTMLMDIFPGAVGAEPKQLTAVEGRLFFEARGFGTGFELWASDGTTDGTVLVKDIQPGEFSSSPSQLVGVNGSLFFTTSADQGFFKLWKSDGTEAGTFWIAVASDDAIPYTYWGFLGQFENAAFVDLDSAWGREPWILLEEDFGDAPDSTSGTFYPTRRFENGAVHLLRPGGPSLGEMREGEDDGLPSSGADGDDLTGIDDEDGIALAGVLLAGGEADLTATATKSGKLNAWLDLNRDGDWADAYEQVLIDAELLAGENAVKFLVRGEAEAGQTYARFRISTAASLSFDGPSDDGEVEDYFVTVTCPLRLDLVDRSLSVIERFEAEAMISTWQVTVEEPAEVILEAPTVALGEGTVIEGNLKIFSSAGDCVH